MYLPTENGKAILFVSVHQQDAKVMQLTEFLKPLVGHPATGTT